MSLKSTEDFAKILPSVSAAARQAGALIMTFYDAAAADPASAGVEIKSDNSPVTKADKAASEYLVTTLQQITPGIVVVSEENDVEPPQDGGLYWTIDPLDGTKEFLNRTGGFAVKIALIGGDQPLLGVVHAPAYDTLYTGVAGGCALKQVGLARAVTLKTRPVSFRQDGLTTLFNATHANESYYHDQRDRLLEKGLILPLVPDPVPNLPRNLRVAEGLADIFANTGEDPSQKTSGGHIWDNAADSLILDLAGGVMVNLIDFGPLPFPPSREKMPGYLAIGDRALGKNLFPELRAR